MLPLPTYAGGSLTGTVRFDGTPPRPKTTLVVLDQGVCGSKQGTEDLLLGPKRTVRNAVVYLKGRIAGGREISTPPDGFVIDQKGCRFVPHVLLTRPNVPVKILNSDGALHTFRTESVVNQGVNRAQSQGVPPIEVKFSRPEIFSVVCDVHSWMKGWIVVAANGFYALTDESGSYRLEDVPAGRYTLTLWHERFGERVRTIEVKEGGMEEIDFTVGDSVH